MRQTVFLNNVMKPGQYHFPIPTRSQTMREAVGVWQNRNIIRDNDCLRKVSKLSQGQVKC